jgi:hypothetical protein
LLHCCKTAVVAHCCKSAVVAHCCKAAVVAHCSKSAVVAHCSKRLLLHRYLLAEGMIEGDCMTVTGPSLSNTITATL